MPVPALVADAFLHLQAGNASRALEAAREAQAAHPHVARVFLAEGVALRMLGRLEEAATALARGTVLDPRDDALAYESGLVNQMQGNLAVALSQFEQARVLNPEFFAAHFSAGSLRFDQREWAEAAQRFKAALSVQPEQVDALAFLARALRNNCRADEADEVFVHALAANPHDFVLLRAFGQHSVARGNFKRAAKLFTEALRAQPDDVALPIFIAQAQLLLGNWDAAWDAYRLRETRRQFEQTLASHPGGYRVPSPPSLQSRDVCLVAEQGLGDILFFLRWVVNIARVGARMHFIGPPALLSMLARTGLFETLHAFGDVHAPAAIPILIGDLPAMFADDPLAVPTLQLTPLPERVARWRERLERAGPRPWVGVTWRAGISPEDSPTGLHKLVPPEMLLAAVRPLGSTFVALQRHPRAEEIAAGSEGLRMPLHDFSDANEDLEDALALVSLLDRYVGVSNANMHLAAAAGKAADVLVPFPPEWRWREDGDSPWFPGFRVYRQRPDGDWHEALAAIKR
ncbi:MAG: tetratricopeptide repeat protein [Usitatibacter sp.]